MEWTNEVIIEFLDLYEAEPVIWNPYNDDHKDRNQVHDAWRRIQAQLSVECSLKDLKRKKEHLMSTFRKLSKKVKKSATTGNETYDEVYKPEWFAYDKMASFLHTVYTARGTATTERQKHDDASDEDNTPSDNEDEAFETVNDVTYSTTLTNGSNNNEREVTEHLTIHQGGPPVGKRRKCEKMVDVEKRMDEAYHFLKQVVTKPKVKKGEIRLFCDLLCTKLEALDERKHDFVMHEIDNLMFNAKHVSNLPNAMHNQHFYQQPQSFTNFHQVGITPYQHLLSAFSFSENSQSYVSPSSTPTSSTPTSSTSSSPQGNQDVIPLHSDSEHKSISNIFFLNSTAIINNNCVFSM